MLRMILSLTLAAVAARAQPGDTQPLRRVVALLDYVGGDYARAVGALGLETRPPDFQSETGPLTPQRIFSAATYGVPKTAMPAFDSGLSDEERWDVAFFILSLAHPAPSPRGLELARAALAPTRYADLAVLSDDDLRRRLGAAGVGGGEQEEALAALRGGPFAEDAQRNARGLAQARAAVQKAVL